MTLWVIWSGNIFFPPLPSLVNSMGFKRTLWIQWMALLRTIKEHGWLIIHGQRGGHSHSCMHLSIGNSLYSFYESGAPFRTDFWGESLRYRTPIHSHTIVLHIYNCPGTRLIFFKVCFIRKQRHCVIKHPSSDPTSLQDCRNWQRQCTFVHPRATCSSSFLRLDLKNLTSGSYEWHLSLFSSFQYGARGGVFVLNLKCM